MGNGKKNQSRHQQITKNREEIEVLIKTVKEMLKAWESHVEHEPNHALISHQEIDDWLGTIAKNEEDHFAMLLELKERVEWNEMPFYRRWWSRFYWWRQSQKEKRETLRNVNRPMSLTRPVITPEDPASLRRVEGDRIAPASPPEPAAAADGDEAATPERSAPSVPPLIEAERLVKGFAETINAAKEEADAEGD